MSVSISMSRRLLGLAVAFAAAAVPAPADAARHQARHHHLARQAAAPTASSAAACADANLTPTSANLDRIAAATLCLINGQRTVHGLAPLRPDGALAAAAAGHSVDMAAHDYFDHVSPSGSDPLARVRGAGYLHGGRSFAIGENIATATGSLATPASTVGRWMQSPGHRDNILNPAYRDTGIGVAAAAPALLGGGRGATYTEDFGAIN